MRRVLTGSSAIAVASLALLLVACNHSPPMTEEPPNSTEPINPGPPVQLTINPGDDAETAMLSATAITYTYRLGRTNLDDRCVGVLPLSGGTRLGEICARGDRNGDSTQAYRWSAPLPSDSLAWFRTSRPIGTDFDREALVVVSALSNPTPFRVLRTFPATSTSAEIHQEPAFLRYIGGGKLAYVGMRFFTKCTPVECRLFFSGREVALLDLAQPGTPPAVVPGTDYASSVSAGPAPGDIVYTVAGSSQVFLRTAAGGISILHDFGAGGIARDVHMAGGRLAAVVGGTVAVDTSDFNDRMNTGDNGGPLIVVNLATGQELTVTDELFVRRPALTPDGRRVVAELAGNLYRFDLP